jgi:hypothetical protein
MSRPSSWYLTLSVPFVLAQCARAQAPGAENTGRTAASASVPSRTAPSVDGTYVLAFREMQDGRRLVSPAVDGVMDLADGYRSLTLIEHNEEGGVVTLSEMSSFSLTDSLYSERMRYRMNTGYSEAEGGGLRENRTGSSRVTLGPNGSTSFTMPLDGVKAVFTADSLTVSMGEVLSDHWVRMTSPACAATGQR